MKSKERRLITWLTLRENCINHDEWQDDISCLNIGNPTTNYEDDGKCRIENCPVWAKLERITK